MNNKLKSTAEVDEFHLISVNVCYPCVKCPFAVCPLSVRYPCLIRTYVNRVLSDHCVLSVRYPCLMCVLSVP